MEIRGCEEEERHIYRWYPEAVFDEEEMHIEILTPCAPLTGSIVLDRFLELAKRMGMRRVSLDDASTVYYPASAYSREECGVSLAVLEILQSGQSWYQRKGFNNKKGRDSLEHNISVALAPFAAFMYYLLQRQAEERDQIAAMKPTPTIRARYEMAQQRAALQPMFLAEIRAHGKASVSEVIASMTKAITSCEDPKLAMVKEIVRLCTLSKNPMVRYDPNDLVKEL